MLTTLRKREEVGKSLRVDAADVADAVVVAVVALIVNVPNSVAQQMNLFVVVRQMMRTNAILQRMIGRQVLTMKSRLLRFRGSAVIEVDRIRVVTATTEVLAETARIVASVLSGVTVRQIVVNVVRTVMIVVVAASDRNVASDLSVVSGRSVVIDRNVVSVLSVASGRNVVTDQLAGNALTVASVRTSLIGKCGETDQTVETVASVQIVVSVVSDQSVAVVTAARSVVVLSVIGVIATGIWIVTNDLSVVAT
jgi:hypothetical protein